jgi:hypothetical protein
MLDILTYLPAKRKQTPSGWISFNAPCCQDRRSRGGIKMSDSNWNYHCFNCSTTASFVLGRTLSFKARKLLTLLGVPEQEIELLNFESLRHRSVHGILDDRVQVLNTLSNIDFNEYDDWPPGSEFVTEDLHAHWQYLRNRKVPEDFPVMTVIKNDGVHWTRPHVTIPFTYNGKVVGWTSRMLDNKTPKYISHSQPGYVFGTDFQQNSWRYVIVTEGIFDAISINGLALMHATVSDLQAKLIRNLSKEIIVVPDQDLAGMDLVDRAVELGWSVSMPPWPSDIKDVNDAVVKYGRLATLLTIIQSRETSKLKIELRKKQLVKQLQNKKFTSTDSQ